MASYTRGSLFVLPSLVAGIIGLIALGNGLVFAQGSTGAITGTVRDSSGAAVAASAVTLKHVDTRLTRAAQSDARGAFSVQSLPVGEYELTAGKKGFRPGVPRGIPPRV